MRRKDREITNIEEILNIIKKTKFLHLGLFDGTYPYIVPMHFGYEYINSKLIFYLHCAKEGHKIDLIKKNNNVCIELDTDVKLIEAADTCAYGSTFSSIIANGKAHIIEEKGEKIKALKLLMFHQVNRDYEINNIMANMVTIIKIECDNFTAKARKK